jgi:hypothetical protein
VAVAAAGGRSVRVSPSVRSAARGAACSLEGRGGCHCWCWCCCCCCCCCCSGCQSGRPRRCGSRPPVAAGLCVGGGARAGPGPPGPPARPAAAGGGAGGRAPGAGARAAPPGGARATVGRGGVSSVPGGSPDRGTPPAPPRAPPSREGGRCGDLVCRLGGRSCARLRCSRARPSCCITVPCFWSGPGVCWPPAAATAARRPAASPCPAPRRRSPCSRRRRRCAWRGRGRVVGRAPGTGGPADGRRAAAGAERWAAGGP